MKRIKFMLFTITMLLAAPAFLTSCQEDAPEINYTMNVSVINDFTKVVEAVNNGSLRNEEAIRKLTEAIDRMNADQATRLQAVIDMLNSVNATLETKLAAIEAAMKAQTLTLESKFALLETAIKNQTIKQEEMATNLITAIDNLQGNIDTKIEAIAVAINNANTTLNSKLELIGAAIKAQTLSIEGKLALLETAVKNQTIKQEEMATNLITAIDNLQGNMDTKIEAVAAAINNANTTLNSKLELIEAAIRAQTLSIGDKLDLLEAAVKALPDYNSRFDAVVAALNAMKTQVEALGNGQTAIATKIGEVTTAINNLIVSVNNGNTGEADAFAQIIAKLEELKAAVGSGSTGGGAGGTVTPGGGEFPKNFYSITLAHIKAKENKMIPEHSVKEAELKANKIYVYKTDKNRYGKLEVITYDSNLQSQSATFKAVIYNEDGSVYKSTDNLKVMNQNFLDLDEMSVFSTDNPFNSEDIFVPMGSSVFIWGGGTNSHIMMAAYTW